MKKYLLFVIFILLSLPVYTSIINIPAENQSTQTDIQRYLNRHLAETKLTASDGAGADYYGCSVSISGDYAIVGAHRDDDNGSDSGSAYIYHYTGTSWIEQQKLTASDGAAHDLFGSSVSISGGYAVIGAQCDDDNGSASGSAYIYHFNGTSWIEQQKLTASDGAGADYFGRSVSISGDYALIGAIHDDDNGTNSGSAYIYHFTGTTWIEQQKLTASDGAPTLHEKSLIKSSKS